MTINYTSAIIFTKHTDMLPWFDSKHHDASSVGFDHLKNSCSKPRDVQLILLMRYEYSMSGTRILCKIKCPINPLPIRGEFEVAHLYRLTQLLEREGWKMERKLPISLLK